MIEAAEDVEIAESRVHKRRLEREAEEVEDWFRDRQRRQAEETETARRQQAAAQIEKQRQAWANQWIEYALNSLPFEAPREIELDVHVSVQQALSGVQPGQAESITKRLVAAAVEKALLPWRRKQDIGRALDAAKDRLAWEVGNVAAFAPLKQRAWEAAVAAVGKLRADASYREMEAATVQAVQPMIREYEDCELCRRVLMRTYISGATSDEQEAATEAAREAVAGQPIGASHKQLERAKEAALAPFIAAVAEREEAERLEAEQQALRLSVERKADFELGHITRYLRQEYEFDGGHRQMLREADRLRPLIREALIEELIDNPELSGDEIWEAIEDLIEDEM